MAPALTLDTLDIIDPDRYAAHGYPHEEWALLRRKAPVYWFDRTAAAPFWAITRRADIVWLSKQPERFLNGPRLAVFPGSQRPPEDRAPVRHLLTMDPPQHAQYRKLVSARFTPAAIARRGREIDQIARGILDDVVAKHGEEGEIDFVTEVSAILPLAAIADMLGVPREDWRLMFQWTNEIVGASDPEYQRPGQTPEETSEGARLGLFEYFRSLSESRRKAPRDDLVSTLVHAEVDGVPLDLPRLLTYYLLLVVAGNETTRNATSGGLLALIENPGELAKLRARPEPEAVRRAAEEIVRWTTPVIQFCRTATEDVELRGQKIRAGDSLCLFYPSANRDEEVFEDPFAFRIDRHPNPHVAFGIGEHFCLGSNLARLELRTIFRHLAERLEHVELAGPAERLRSSFLGGVKHVPIRYRLRRA